MGDPSVLVAVIDTGIDWDHADLAANYVPLGYDWVNNDTDPMDDHGHGTHCAGIIGAVTDNSIGIAGLGQVRIMAEKGLSQYGSGSEDDLANAIVHAVDQGADILSNSWGSDSKSMLIQDAVQYAHDNDVLVIAAAGNEACNKKHYPAAYDEVMAVTATDESDNPAGFTKFGDWVEVAAPGVHIYSTIWDDSYADKSGTSMSAPHVAGVAALIWSQFPNMTQDQVRTQLRYTANDLGYPGFDVYYGHSRTNVRRTVERIPIDHDLVTSHLETLPYVKLGSTAMINITVFNFGTEDESDIALQLLVNGSLANSTVIGSLASMKSATVSFPWIHTVEGIYNVTSYVVPTPAETVTGNNALSTCVAVRTPQAFRVPKDYPTIQAATNTAVSGIGDTIEVAAGTYYEHITIDKSVTIAGEDRSPTIIDGKGTGTVVHMIPHIITRARVYVGNGVNLSRFTIRNGEHKGIYLFECSGCTLRDNYTTGNGFNFGVSGNLLSHFIHDIDISNVVDGKPIYYWVNEHNKQIPADAGYVTAVNSTNIDVRSLNLTNNVHGVLFAYTAESLIENVNASSNKYSVYLYTSSNNTISSNTITDNMYGIYLDASHKNVIDNNTLNGTYFGIALDHADENILRGNKVTGGPRLVFAGIVLSMYAKGNVLSGNIVSDNWFGFGAGIYLEWYSNNNIINQDTLEKNQYGINLGGYFREYCSNNTVSGNNITNNNNGIRLKSSADNEFHHNNFTNNSKQVYISTSGDANFWDNGYPSGGNYWSDYSGTDLCSSSYQNITGSDGIGDAPYVIDADNQDHYPLMNPWTPTPVARFVWTPLMPKTDEYVTFDASYSTPNGGTIVRYEWSFGDDETANGKMATHIYANPDNYTVTLNVTDSEGLWHIEQKQIQVVQPHGPEAEFTATPKTALTDESVKLDASASFQDGMAHMKCPQSNTAGISMTATKQQHSPQQYIIASAAQEITT